MAWLLLVLTFVSAWLTVDALRWKREARDMPFSAVAGLWKSRLRHLSAAERESVRERYRFSLWGVGQIPWLFAAVTLMLAVVTIREFAAS